MHTERRVVVLPCNGLYFLVCCQVAVIKGEDVTWEDVSTLMLHEDKLGRAITDYMVTGDWNWTNNQRKVR